MKRILLAAFACVALFFTSCNSGSDPKAVLGQFFSALGNKDIAAARKLATAESKSLLDMMEIQMKTDNSESEKYKAANLEIGDAKIEGDKATVPVKEKSSGEEMKYILKKENGSWKVAFDKNTLMNIATEKMSEEGINIGDSIKNAMDEVKNLDTDSLTNAVKQGLDSASKALEELNKK